MSLTCMVQRGIDDAQPGSLTLTARRPAVISGGASCQHLACLAGRARHLGRGASRRHRAGPARSTAPPRRHRSRRRCTSRRSAPIRRRSTSSRRSSCGPKEALLFDTQYHLADARRLADRIAASGKHLKAIILSHPDHDHFAGAAAIVERFPGTPVYMTAKALEEYKRTAPPRVPQREVARAADACLTAS